MRIRRLLAWFFMILAFMALGAEILMALEAGSYSILRNGDFWFAAHAASLNAAQAGIERYIHPYLWDPIIVFFLRWPLWLLPLILAALFWLCDRFRRKKKRFFA